MKIALVVDDEPLIRRKVAELLDNYGFDEILQAGNGQEALLLAVTHKPVLVVMDVTMPVMNGITAATKIGIEAPAPIVLLTGNSDSETIAQARDAGVMSYLLKPFRDEQLFAAVELAMHQYMAVSSLHDQVRKLEETLETRKLVDKAKGVLMGTGLSEPEAYRKMQKLAMGKRKTMKQVAEAIMMMAE
jgi:response regulator NasT